MVRMDRSVWYRMSSVGMEISKKRICPTSIVLFFSFLMRYCLIVAIFCFLWGSYSLAEVVTVEVYEQDMSIAQSVSVQIAGQQDMTYCSLLTRINLERFTGV